MRIMWVPKGSSSPHWRCAPLGQVSPREGSQFTAAKKLLRSPLKPVAERVAYVATIATSASDVPRIVDELIGPWQSRHLVSHTQLQLCAPRRQRASVRTHTVQL